MNKKRNVTVRGSSATLNKRFVDSSKCVDASSSSAKMRILFNDKKTANRNKKINRANLDRDFANIDLKMLYKMKFGGHISWQKINELFGFFLKIKLKEQKSSIINELKSNASKMPNNNMVILMESIVKQAKIPNNSIV